MKLPPFFQSLGNYSTRIHGHKGRLISHLFKWIPKGIKSFGDLFAGSGCVGYAVKKTFGAKILCNDIRRYSYRQTMACIFNNNVTLSADDLAMLTRPNPARRDHTYRFYEEIFGRKNSKWMDNWAANIPNLQDPIKRDIAMFIPTERIFSLRSFGGFSFSQLGILSGDQSFEDINLGQMVIDYALNKFPSLVVDNGQDNEVFSEEALSLVPHWKVDVLYADPPYYTNGRGGDYETRLAFLDRLIQILSGRGDEITNPLSCSADLPPYNNFLSRSSALMGFAQLFKTAHHIPLVIVSYNETSKVKVGEIVDIAKMYDWSVEKETIPYPKPTNRKGNVFTETEEVLLICRNGGAK